MPLVNFDGIPGPTHNYAGLARGNLAAERNARQVANPRAAALQGLAKARALAARGFHAGRAAAARASGHQHAARARIFRQRRRHRCTRRQGRSAASRRMLVGGRDVVRERRDREPFGGHRRRPRAFHAGESRQPLPSRHRSADDDPRASRDLRGSRGISRCTTRCPPRRSSATRARRITSGSPRRRRARASSSSSSAARRTTARPPRRKNFRRGRRGRLRPPSRVATVSTRRARFLHNRIPMRSMPASSTTM